MTRSDRVEALIRKESELETKLNLINAEIKAEQQALADATKKEKLYRECSELLVNTSLSIQRNTTEKIAKIVTDLYQYVFLSDDNYMQNYTFSANIVLLCRLFIPINALNVERGGRKIAFLSAVLNFSDLSTS